MQFSPSSSDLYQQFIDHEAVAEQERIRQKLERVTQYFAKVNSALSFRKVSVRVENSPSSAPAYSTSNEVVFNSRLIGELNTAKDIAMIRGADLHELSHILYSPRTGSTVWQTCIENKWFDYFNVLEDQRIESLFTSAFPSTVDWFIAMRLKFFIDDQELFVRSYPMIAGLRYIPAQVRKQSRALFPKQEIVQELNDIISEYRTIIYPIDESRGLELIEQFANLLKDVDMGGGHGGGSGSGEGVTLVPAPAGTEGDVTVLVRQPLHGDRPSEGIESSTSRPRSIPQQKRDRERMTKSNKPVIDLTNADVNIAPQPAPKSDHNSDQNDPSNDPSLSAGKDAGEIMQTILDQLLNDAEISKEINDMVRVFGGLPSLKSNNSEIPNVAEYKSLNPDSITLEGSRSFGRELERVKSHYDPSWIKYESRGRLNAGRYIKGADLNIVFDRFSEGNADATNIECVIALDVSGSMSGVKASSAYKAMWAIKRALDRIEASTTVITFSDEVHTLYRADETANNTIRDAGTGGGTEADEAIRVATKILAESERSVKIFFAITDGEWSGDQTNNHEAIKSMGRAGVLTSFAYIPYESETITLTKESAHYCDIASVVRNPLDLVGMARAIVRNAITRRISV